MTFGKASAMFSAAAYHLIMLGLQVVNDVGLLWSLIIYRIFQKEMQCCSEGFVV